LRQPLIARYHQYLVSSQHPYLDAAAAEVAFALILQGAFNDRIFAYGTRLSMARVVPTNS
jgi:hypothetical protein